MRDGRKPCSARWTGSTSSDLCAFGSGERSQMHTNRNQAAASSCCLVLVVELDVGDGRVLLEVSHRRGARNQEHVRRDGQRPRERDLRRCAAEFRRLALDGGVAEHRVVGGECRAEREERNERDAALDAEVEHRLRRPVDEVVGVLDADDLGAVQGDLQVIDGDAAQSDSVDEAFVAGLDHRVQLAVEQFAVDFGRCVGITAAEYAQVHGGKSVGVQRAAGCLRCPGEVRRVAVRPSHAP